MQNKNKNKNHSLKCATWNICRGLVTREYELKNLLETKDIDVMFLTETDLNNLETESDYIIQGYKTILPMKKDKKDKVRILCLTKDVLVSQVKTITELMNPSFPSIWLELTGNENSIIMTHSQQ